jgi:hypothetical protein
VGVKVALAVREAVCVGLGVSVGKIPKAVPRTEKLIQAKQQRTQRAREPIPPPINNIVRVFMKTSDCFRDYTT